MRIRRAVNTLQTFAPRFLHRNITPLHSNMSAFVFKRRFLQRCDGLRIEIGEGAIYPRYVD